jgi:hypothetical protein
VTNLRCRKQRSCKQIKGPIKLDPRCHEWRRTGEEVALGQRAGTLHRLPPATSWWDAIRLHGPNRSTSLASPTRGRSRGRARTWYRRRQRPKSHVLSGCSVRPNRPDRLPNAALRRSRSRRSSRSRRQTQTYRCEKFLHGESADPAAAPQVADMTFFFSLRHCLSTAFR